MAIYLARRAAPSIGHSALDAAHSLRRLSSGRRIERAADDPAGAAVASNLGAVEGSLRQLQRSYNDGLSMLAIVEGAAREVISSLRRMRELAVRGATETLSVDERDSLQAELEALSAEINRVAESTSFGGLLLLNNSARISTQANVSGAIGIPRADFRTNSSSMQLSSVNLQSSTSASSSIQQVEWAIDYVNGVNAEIGAAQNRLDSAIRWSDGAATVVATAAGRIVDADMALESATLARAQILENARIAVVAQLRALDRSVLGGLL